MSPRYAKVPVQTGLSDGEDASPCFSRKHLRTTELIPSMPIRRSQIAEEPSWNARWTSSWTSSYEMRRWEKCKRPDNPFANACCKSGLWNLIAPPWVTVSKQNKHISKVRTPVVTNLSSSSLWYKHHQVDHFCEHEIPCLERWSYR